MSRHKGTAHTAYLGTMAVWHGTAVGEKEALDKLHGELIDKGHDTLEEFAASYGFTMDDFSVTKD